jgi:ABC-2 type transport system ATP-binding protein
MKVGDVGLYFSRFFPDYELPVFDALIREMELTPDLRVKALSSGMMAKLKIAVTLARDAKVYMLDEPFNGIDLLARDEIRTCILQFAAEDKILLLSSHLVEEMEAVADRAIFIKQGHLEEIVDLETMRTEYGISMADRYRQIYGHEEVTSNV